MSIVYSASSRLNYGKKLASAGYDRSIRLWDVASGRELLTEGRHAGGVSDASALDLRIFEEFIEGILNPVPANARMVA